MTPVFSAIASPSAARSWLFMPRKATWSPSSWCTGSKAGISRDARRAPRGEEVHDEGRAPVVGERRLGAVEALEGLGRAPARRSRRCRGDGAERGGLVVSSRANTSSAATTRRRQHGTDDERRVPIARRRTAVSTAETVPAGSTAGRAGLARRVTPARPGRWPLYGRTVLGRWTRRRRSGGPDAGRQRHLVDHDLGPGVLGRPAPLALLGRIRPLWSSWPPHTPHGSWRSRASARQGSRTGHFEQMALARAMSMRSSEKNRTVSVPAPSLQRALAHHAAGAASGLRVSSSSWLSLMAYMSGSPKSSAEKEKGRRVYPGGLWASRRFGGALRRRLAEPSGGVGLVCHGRWT